MSFALNTKILDQSSWVSGFKCIFNLIFCLVGKHVQTRILSFILLLIKKEFTEVEMSPWSKHKGAYLWIQHSWLLDRVPWPVTGKDWSQSTLPWEQARASEIHRRCTLTGVSLVVEKPHLKWQDWGFQEGPHRFQFTSEVFVCLSFS